jgi:hypothetical protein
MVLTGSDFTLQAHATTSTLLGQATSPSWNPATNCKAVVMTMEEFIGRVPNPTQIQPNVGADYGGGALQLEGAKLPGTNPPSSQWPYSKRSTNPPCTVTLANGTVLPTMVETHGIKVTQTWLDECGSVLPGQCDQVFDTCNTALAPNCSTAYSDTMHQVHDEIDIYWNHSGIAPPRPTAGTTIDIQGFVFWDDFHLKDSWHLFSGWEIHPVSAWRLSSPDFGVRANPSGLSAPAGSSATSEITVTSINGFTGTVSLSDTVTSSSISIVQPTVSINPATVSLSTAGSAKATLTISTSLITTPGTYTITVIATSGQLSHSATVTFSVTLT